MKLEYIVSILFVFVLLFAGVVTFYKTGIEEQDARTFVIEDLRQQFPTADIIEVIYIEERLNEKGEVYYFMKAKVTEGYYTPCPKRTHYYYNYPEQNFVTLPPEEITADCIVLTSPGNIISFEEEAIIASHTLEGTERVEDYIEVHADAIPSVSSIDGDWVIEWDSPSSEYGYEVTISKNGTLINVSRTE